MQHAGRFDTDTNARIAGGRGLDPASLLRAAALIVAGVSIAACDTADTGASIQLNPPPAAGGSSYSGPPPATDDVQSFKLNLWDNIEDDNRCGSCHSTEGGQVPMFARRDDVNLAYAAANNIVTLIAPEDSEMVTKVGGGHNCWLASDAACAEILTTWISNWAGDLVAGGGREIELEAPLSIRDPGESKSFPDDPLLFAATVYEPVLAEFCADCHASTSALQQSPFFAEGPLNDPNAVAAAYEAAKSKIDLDDPAASRFVVRLREEFHNCWTASCANDADDMEQAIADFAAGVTPTAVDPSLVTSKALTLYEGTIASGGNRYEANVIANYEFKTGQGTTAYDTSGVEPAADLTLSGAVEWFGGWGLNFQGGKAQASTTASSKLRALIGATGEYSIEAWVVPGNVVQENARIVSYSASVDARNFMLGQTMYNYDFFNTSSNSIDANGNPQLSTPDAAEVLQATLQHVVATFDPVEGRKIYVNGVLVADQDPAPGGTLGDWNDTFALVLGREISDDGVFMGVIRLVAIHNRALTQAQITQNFEAGVGEKFFLLFSVEHLTGVAESYVVFEAAVFDSYAYLFRQPFFISLDETADPSGIDLEGMRIGLNGSEATVGQAFANLDTAIDGTLYDAATGQVLSTLGAVVPLEKGPNSDEFFLTFDRLASNSFPRPAPPTPTPPAPVDLPESSKIGVRTFDEVNATMSRITGVSALDSNVRSTFGLVRQSMPAVPTIEGVLASHQVAIAQLAIEYCNALIEDQALRASVFPAFSFALNASAAFPANQANLIDPLLDRMLGAVQIETQPSRALVTAELDELVNGIPGDATRPGLVNNPAYADDTERTEDIAKAVCSAVIGSAAMLVQ